MQHWRQSDCVSADCWVTDSMGGPAGSRIQTIFAVGMEQTAGQKWAPLAHLNDWIAALSDVCTFTTENSDGHMLAISHPLIF